MDKKKPNIVFSVLAVCASLALYCLVAWWRGGSFFLKLTHNTQTANSSAYLVVIRTSDGIVDRLSLDEDCRRSYSTNLGTNVVVIENNTVRIEDADCANQICVNEGAISHVGQQLICLPHQFSVEIEASSFDPTNPDEYDTVSR